MAKELKLFLAAVGLPAAILLLLVLRLVTLERRAPAPRPEHRMEMPPEGRRRPPMRGRRPGPWSERYDGDRFRWIVAGVLGLAALSTVSGGWVLMKSARKAKEESLQKTDFLSNISHEFKTPLTTICLCAELAQDEGLSSERRHKALQAISSESERLKALILNALDFSRLEKGLRQFKLESADLGALAREVAESMRERFPLGLEVAADECPARCDEGAVRQIVACLLDNAAKYAANSGPVRIEAEGRSIKVRDEGPGLAAGDLKHVFDRFWRGDNRLTAETGGSGLGLGIARELARGMGGDLTVARNGDKGLIFEFKL
jgi:signal transduction histidine kinase